MTLIPAIRTRLGPMYAMKSDREIGHIVRAVLAEIRELSENMVAAGIRQADECTDGGTASAACIPEHAFRAMIDALAKEVEG